MKARARFISENEILTKLEKDFIKSYIQGNRSEWNKEYLSILFNKCINRGISIETPNWYICYLGAELNKVSSNYPFKLLCQLKIINKHKTSLIATIINFFFSSFQ